MVIYIETIKMQAASGQEAVLNDQLTALMRSVEEHPDCQELIKIGAYEHATIPGYFAIHLYWNSEYHVTLGSRFGLSLIQSFKPFGLVDHVVWVEKESRASSDVQKREKYHIYSI